VGLLVQSAGGVSGISGTVHDPAGGVVLNAKVVISSTVQEELRSITTNEAGVFAAPALIPGPGYKVTISAAGFAPYEVAGLVLQVGTKTDISQAMDTQSIMNLSIYGRRVGSFVLNTPGVTNDNYFGLSTFRGVAGNNSFLLDGNDNTEQF
jgi:Carboxypeptidase regulatory-like domain